MKIPVCHTESPKKLNNRRPAAAHEAVNPKKICCFFCAHFWQISKCSVLDSEAKKGCRFFQTAGKTQLPKRLIVGKDRAAGKVLAGKFVHSALLWFVGSKGENASPPPFMKKAGYRFLKKVAVANEGNPVAFYKKAGCDFLKKWQ